MCRRRCYQWAAILSTHLFIEVSNLTQIHRAPEYAYQKWLIRHFMLSKLRFHILAKCARDTWVGQFTINARSLCYQPPIVHRLLLSNIFTEVFCTKKYHAKEYVNVSHIFHKAAFLYFLFGYLLFQNSST